MAGGGHALPSPALAALTWFSWVLSSRRGTQVDEGARDKAQRVGHRPDHHQIRNPRWQAIEDKFKVRNMPSDLRCAYWRPHAGRELYTSNEFALRANQAIPQGSPESPAVYAAVIEGLLDRVERRLHRAGLPAGLPLCSEGDATEVEDYKHSRKAFQPDDIFAANFADDTYVLARETREAEYTSAVIRQEYARANQMLHPKKCQALTTSTKQPIQMWDDEQLKLHEAGQPLGEGRDNLEHIQVVKAMVVLGSVISFEEPTEAPLQARRRASWTTYTECRGQLLQRTISIAHSVKLLESTVLASFMWGLESVDLREKQLSTINASQSTMVLYMTRHPRRARETDADYFPRRERIISGIIAKHSRGKWGELQRYMYYTFQGHLARLPSSIHLAARVSLWRGWLVATLLRSAAR